VKTTPSRPAESQPETAPPEASGTATPSLASSTDHRKGASVHQPCDSTESRK